MRHRVRFLAGYIIVGAVLAASAAAFAGSIIGSRHDLSGLNVRGYGSETGPMTGGSFSDYRETCVYCHTPHNAGTVSPLWNRMLPEMTDYQMYDGPNIDSKPRRAPDGISLGCLSCHDGSVAVDAVYNKPKFHDIFDSGIHYKMNFDGAVGSDSCGKCHNRDKGAYGGLGAAHDATIRYLSKNLRDDHPISVTYPTHDQDSAFNQPTVAKQDGGRAFTNGIQTFEGDKVQCASCHDPHNPDEQNLEGRDPFLRSSNRFSALCLTCHQK
jgi:hypothetical protein